MEVRQAGNDKIRILLVDDCELIREVTAESLLSNIPWSIVTLADCVDAGISKIHESEFDIIICDYNMPGKLGTVLLEHVQDHNLEVPVIMFTGTPDDDSLREIEQKLRPCIDRIVRKPSVGKLESEVKNMLGLMSA